MANEITRPTPPNNAGQDFGYAVWTAGTGITLCNVPWNADYRDIVKFENQAKLDEYLTKNAGPTVQIKGASYARVNQPVRLGISFNEAYRFNYVRVENPAQPRKGGDTPRAFYYFINDVRHIAPDTTVIDVQLDVWQTFGYSVKFGNSFIERGHVGIADVRQLEDFGREYLTVPEGLDIGNEYVVKDRWSETISTANVYELTNGVPPEPNGDVVVPEERHPGVIVISTVDLLADAGDVSNPKLNAATGSSFESLPQGGGLYYFDSPTELRVFLSRYSEKPWVTQGIISIQAIPKISRYGINLSSLESQKVGSTAATIYKLGFALAAKRVSLAPSWRHQSGLLPERYKNLKKFLTSPYSVFELTSYSGTPLIIKPESWADESCTVVEMPHFSPPSPRIMFMPFRYNAKDISAENRAGAFDGGEYLDMMTGISNFPTFSVVNNSYVSFLASNKNSLAWQNQSADWSQQKALAGNDLSYNQASAGMNLANTQANLSIGAANSTTALNNEFGKYRAIQGAVNDVAGGLMGGSPLSILGGGISAANRAVSYNLDVNQSNQQNAINTGLTAASNKASVDNAGYNRDTNKAYADYAAKGDYSNAIAGINARVQAARMTQPSTSGQMGGDAFNLARFKWGYDLKLKMPNAAAMRVVGDFWLRYGYAIQRFIKVPASLMVMEKFTFWKLKETYITSSECPEPFKQAIRGIFESGVTVWKNPADIGNIDIADNNPIGGFYL